MLKCEHFRINIVVVAYPAFVYVVSRAGRQVILARNYMCSLMMISSTLSKHVGAVKSVLKKLFKNKLHTINAFVGFVIIIESTRCTVQQ